MSDKGWRMFSVEEIEQKSAKIVDDIVMLDKWADIEELTFPLEVPSEDEQIAWLETFMQHLATHLRGLLEDEFS